MMKLGWEKYMMTSGKGKVSQFTLTFYINLLNPNKRNVLPGIKINPKLTLVHLGCNFINCILRKPEDSGNLEIRRTQMLRELGDKKNLEIRRTWRLGEPGD